MKILSNIEAYIAVQIAWTQEFVMESLRAVPDCYVAKPDGDSEVLSLGKSNVHLIDGNVYD